MIFTLFGHVDSACKSGNFLGFPSWNEYLHTHNNRECAPHLEGLDDIWKIGLALVEILLRVAILAAVFFVMFAGIKYTASRGNADKTESAKKTLEDALVGLVIAVAATAVVSFVAGRFS
jgi:hypothetical protein